MGACFLIVNLAKRQFLDPDRFGDNNKWSGILDGNCGEIFKILITDQRSEFRTTPFVSKWLGDPIALASDDHGEPNPNGMMTSTEGDANRNLYRMAKAEFTNISFRAIAELSFLGKLSSYMELVQRDDCFFVDLVTVMQQYQLSHVEDGLQRTFGKEWVRLYEQAARKLPAHHSAVTFVNWLWPRE